MTKQIHTLMRGIIRFMVFMVACCWASPPGVGLDAELTFIDRYERPAEMKGIRNRPMAAQV